LTDLKSFAPIVAGTSDERELSCRLAGFPGLLAHRHNRETSMSATRAVGLMTLAVFSLCAPLQADDKDKASATGTWKWTRKTQDGQEQELKAEFKQDGEKLTGKIISPMGEAEVKEGTIKKGDIAFTITFERDGNEFKVKFTGKLDGDKIKGKVEFTLNGEKQSRDWEPTRVKEEKKGDK
jgi:hypothetical protein